MLKQVETPPAIKYLWANKKYNMSKLDATTALPLTLNSVSFQLLKNKWEY